MKFTVEISEYEAGVPDEPVSKSRIEDAVQQLMEVNGDDGIVVVREAED